MNMTVDVRDGASFAIGQKVIVKSQLTERLARCLVTVVRVKDQRFAGIVIHRRYLVEDHTGERHWHYEDQLAATDDLPQLWCEHEATIVKRREFMQRMLDSPSTMSIGTPADGVASVSLSSKDLT